MTPDKRAAVTTWMDSKQVTFISNFCSTITSTSYRRRGGEADITMPIVAKRYRETMGNVDSFERSVKRYRVKRTTQRWWLTLFFYLIDCTINNAWKLLIWNNPPARKTHRRVRLPITEESALVTLRSSNTSEGT